MKIHKHTRVVGGLALAASAIALWPMTASAQAPLGTFRWQLEPHCNIVSVAVTPSGSVFRLEGSDDQCGGGDLASTIGTAFLNPDGTVGIGLNIVSTPGGAPVHVDAAISVATLNGTWRDSAGNTGNFTFRAGAGSGGTPRLVSGTIGAVSVNPSQVQLRIGGNCSSGFFMQSVAQNGTVTCASEVGDITGVLVGPGLVGGASSGAAALSLPLTATAAFDLTNRFGFVSSATNTPAPTPPPLSGPGTRLLWHPGKAAFRVGQVDSTHWDQANIGFGSVAMGIDTIARGETAFAMGRGAVASGNSSVALGSNVSASTDGTFMFGDRSTATPLLTFVPNQFLVRAAGGTGIHSNAALTAGVVLAPGSSSWSSVSDVNMKENFRDLDGEDVLTKIARMPVREWNYKAQDSAIRHVGPTAQDFAAAFGFGEDPLRISTIDADGIALRAIQALEARTRELMQENAELEARLVRLEARRP